jgi:hypothetical protein
MNSLNSYEGKIKGTLIISVVAVDGAIIAVDSRAGITASDKSVLAYFDNVPKLFILKNKYLIAFAGDSTIGEYFVSALIETFNNNNNSDLGFTSTCLEFKNYLLSTKAITQKFYCAGIENNKPMLFSFGGTQQSSEPFALLSSENLNNYIKDFSFFKLPCWEMIPKLEEMIYQYSKDNNCNFTIGGPISIAMISLNNEIHWLQNDFSKNKFNTYTELVNAIKAKKINLIPTTENGVNAAISAMEKNRNYRT